MAASMAIPATRSPSSAHAPPRRAARHTPRRTAPQVLLPAVLLCVAALHSQHHRVDAKLITGLAPCPNGAPPARECLVSVLVDLRALRARARERSNATASSLTPSAKDPALETPQQELPPPQPIDDEARRREEQQQRRQQQLEQAVRFQEDELQQLREQVQELRLQLARALQLYQLPSPQGVKSPALQLRGGYYPPTGPTQARRAAPDLRAGYTGYGPAHEQAGRRFYRTLPPPAAARTAPAPPPAPVFGQRLSLVGLRELASGEAVVAT